MKPKYKRGKRIKSVGDFEKSKSLWYKVLFGNYERTRHRGFLESWQYHTLDMFIRSGCVFEAEVIDDMTISSVHTGRRKNDCEDSKSL